MIATRTARALCLLLFVVLVGGRPAAAQEPSVAKVDAFVDAAMRAQKIPGLPVEIIRKGRVVLAKGYGLANVELNVPASPETIYQSGSVGKQFTAAAVMLLVEQGAIRLDEPVGSYLPSAPASWSGVTIRRLLTHT